MSIIDALGQIIKPVTSLIDGLTTTSEEKLQLKNEMQRIQNELSSKYIELDKELILAKQNIMVAELSQSDKYTKRARPTIVYGGLIILAINNVILPWIAFFTGYTLPTINLPTEFWIAWGGVCGIYAFRRTTEKNQVANDVINSIGVSNK